MHTTHTHVCSFHPLLPLLNFVQLSQKRSFFSVHSRAKEQHFFWVISVHLAPDPTVSRRKTIKYGNEIRHSDQNHQLLKYVQEPRALQGLVWISIPAHLCHSNPHFLQDKQFHTWVEQQSVLKSLALQPCSFLLLCAHSNLSFQRRERTDFCLLLFI